MIDALQIFVRGFEDGQRGEVIVSYLREIGFTVKEILGGHLDNLGGLIETDVVNQEELEETDPEIILSELRERTGFNAVWLQTREFQSGEEGEYGREGDEEKVDSNVLTFLA